MYSCRKLPNGNLAGMYFRVHSQSPGRRRMAQPFDTEAVPPVVQAYPVPASHSSIGAIGTSDVAVAVAAVPVAAKPVPAYAKLVKPVRFVRQASRRVAHRLDTRIKKARSCFTLSVCCFLILFPSTFIPGYVMLKNLQKINPEEMYGPAGGLQDQPSQCTIVAVFHRNVRYRHIGHHHHPHHPHHPHNPHGHSPSSGRRLLDDPAPRAVHQHHPTRQLDKIASAAAHAHHPHQHSPVRTDTPKAPEQAPVPQGVSAFRATSPLEATTPASAAAPHPPLPEAEWSESDTKNPTKSAIGRRRLGHYEDECYDRFVFAFGAGVDLDPPSGETLDATLDRMLERGWQTVDPTLATARQSGGTRVVLSPPVHTKRSCNFNIRPSFSNGPRELYSRSVGSPWGTIMEISLAEEGYAAPFTDVSRGELCARAPGSELAAWYTNPSQGSILPSSGPVYRRAPPWLAWTFEEGAPSAWALGQIGINMLYASKQFAGPPPIRLDAQQCRVPSLTARSLTDGCMERIKPAEWTEQGAACPLRAGGRLPCWYAREPNSSNAAEVLRLHGCAPSPPPRGAETLTKVVEQQAGPGPSNPYCMTIFDPRWRLNDWLIAEWVNRINQHDPYPTYIAGIVLGSVFGAFSLVSGVCWLILARNQ